MPCHPSMALSVEALHIDPGTTISSIAVSIQATVHRVLHRRGAVIGLSGGIDSSLCAALCASVRGLHNKLLSRPILTDKTDFRPTTCCGALALAIDEKFTTWFQK